MWEAGILTQSFGRGAPLVGRSIQCMAWELGGSGMEISTAEEHCWAGLSIVTFLGYMGGLGFCPLCMTMTTSFHGS
jgi:hypothetical protein